ncbi:GNAT family N-acetyltransferase [Chitinibacter sp. SCUT-21]|uniref:GNAT family N-acetyltransferase n=1 Tax=Chitinibacter sp. SCUT-21 TaxID=2970891 RepID=UPI0035A68130
MQTITLHAPSLNDYADLLAFEIDNRAFFEARINARPASYYSEAGLIAAIEQAQKERSEDRAYQFLVRNLSQQLLARVNLTQVRRQHFHSAQLGYRVAQAAQGQGVAKQAVRQILAFAFDELQLQRVEAVVMESNLASIAVLKANGFQQYGRTEASFELAGQWHNCLYFEARKP